MPKADWRPDILSGWRIQLSSTLAAHDFWELIMMTWSSELFREDRTRRYSNGALHTAENPAKKKSLFGMRFLANVVGEMKRAPTCKRPRSDQTGAIATIFRLGWICMTSKKGERREHLFPLSTESPLPTRPPDESSGLPLPLFLCQPRGNARENLFRCSLRR